MSRIFKFPEGFLWGTATAAHQIEGNNTNSDWWEWETNKKSNQTFPKEPSGIACDSYKRYEEDFDLCSRLNNNAVRISVEWARLEPEDGKFSQEEFDHYKRVIISAKKRGLKTFVTLHHFTNPSWIAKKGGWVNIRTPGYFKRYARKCAEEFGGLVDVFLTINEPEVYTFMGYVRGTWPPCKKSYFLATIAQINFIRAHKKAYKTIKAINKSYTVGIVKNIMWYEYAKGPAHIMDLIASKILYYLNDDLFLKPLKKHIDLIGLNFYFTSRIKNLKIANLDDMLSYMGWWIFPPGLEKVLLKLKRYNLPIYITENGVADPEDKVREEFLARMLASCAKALEQGVPLKGYFYWSLIDNFEWHEGYWPCFGLVSIDRNNNLQRIPRESFNYYSKICGDNEIQID